VAFRLLDQATTQRVGKRLGNLNIGELANQLLTAAKIHHPVIFCPRGQLPHSLFRFTHYQNSLLGAYHGSRYGISLIADFGL
jgi:hypothetical protein